MRHLCITLLCLLSGCVQFGQSSDGTYAVDFDGKPSCIEAESHSSHLGSPEDGFTIEAWVQAADEVSYERHPLIIWNGAFALWSGAEGEGHFTDSTTDLAGADGANGWMDGELHHVAGTYADGTANLYLDGQKVAFNTNSALGTSPTGSIYIGCWASTDLHHQGLIDEVRLSSTVRYTSDFDPPAAAFSLDTETIHLWHFDEGEQDVGLDEASLADAYLSRVEWVEFSISGDDTAAR